ncbi:MULTISPECIES: mercury resistance system transport protein MerF [Bacillaceae]|uniref:mercury resistance system transport protein MerF n=1 Tax=Bacillaceae TaxID=186817 RepID=UPI000BFCD74F|nr:MULTISPECIES: mercury resistance system transport protein MerF [Bacillaceae]MCM3164119.1 mercury resistance system transport protein MerF [Metabacillus litoralis]PGT84072.1 mercury transporter [Bacillus sp. AFS040349]UGB33480.1 mercury resistance system transport protein MerF [Metabacillus sp. B2-18]
MKHKKTFIAGLIGTFVVLLCCATPILVILLGAIGLGAITGYLDYVLIPVVVVFLGLTLYAYSKYEHLNKNREM